MPVNEEGLDRLKSGRYRVLIVPGFLSQLYTAFSHYSDTVFDGAVRGVIGTITGVGPLLARQMPELHLPWPKGGMESFATQKEFFKVSGIPFVDISQRSDSNFNSQKSVAHNASAIASLLREAGDERHIVLSHSKGGLDTLEALLQNRELARQRVDGWVALQAPFHGSLIADLTGNQVFTSILLMALGGDRQSLGDLTIAARKDYMTKNADGIRSLTSGERSIPIVSGYTTYKTSEKDNFHQAIINLAARVSSTALLEKIAEDYWKHLKETWNPAEAAVLTAADVPALVNSEVNHIINQALSPFGLMDLSNLLLANLGENDGLVTTGSAALQGSTMKQLPLQADHAAPVMNAAPFRQFWTPEQRNQATLDLLTFVAARAAT